MSYHRLNLLTFNSLMGYCAEKCKQRLLKWKYWKNSKWGCVQLGRDQTQFTMCFYIVTFVATSISSWPSVCRQRLALIVSIPHKDQENSWAISTPACPIWFQWGIMKMLPANVTTNVNFFVLPLMCLLLVWGINILALNYWDNSLIYHTTLLCLGVKMSPVLVCKVSIYRNLLYSFTQAGRQTV